MWVTSLAMTPSGPNASHHLYISHFLSTWNSRGFEFGAVLFLATIYPGTLLPLSIYALIRAASAIVLSPLLGRYIDHGERLQVVRISILGQRAAVIFSCLGFLHLLAIRDLSKPHHLIIFSALVILACMEKLCSIMNTVAIERDWVVVIGGCDEIVLQNLNSQMRRIDLISKLISPLVIALVDGFSTSIAVWSTLGLNAASAATEYVLIARVFTLVPALGAMGHRAMDESQAMERTAVKSPFSLGVISSEFKTLLLNLRIYTTHRAFLPSLSLSLLYLTVLSFSGQMVAYLLSVGYTSILVGLVRTLSTTFEVSATWFGPRIMTRIGSIRAGIWFLSWQMICLTVGVGLLWSFEAKTMVAASALVGAVVMSRIGLWGFELCAQLIIQNEIESEHRGSFSTLEAALQNFFELCLFATTIAFSRPSQFLYPALISVIAVYLAGGLYAKFVFDRRGHLLHMPPCMKLRDPHRYEVLELRERA